ncbi:hypothetical protein [Gordonia sp. (in: high G+C Gram-positive bacteria)]|uniref:hypothetical protein n=1 Tax=Gordonia sp. (in: high G+C Gram-positive bacteria) TaxID=84139 RepID=UPI0016A732F9|nr:hypothetical protein [Gordonia sp. (in: high G+C Gram-positive bacteria)]NLG44987.1 hypothetical protein [Gordonia sp. (in: high G+C Gram-positive bacteria)]
MSTPGQPDSDPFGETMSRPLPTGGAGGGTPPPYSLTKAPSTDQSGAVDSRTSQIPTSQFPTADYSDTQYAVSPHYSNEQYTDQHYSDTQYANTPYPGNQHPSGPPTGGGYPVYGYSQPPSGGNGRAVLLGIAIACIIGLVAAAAVIWTKVANSDDDVVANQPGTTEVQQAPDTVTEVVDPTADALRQLQERTASDATTIRSSHDNRWAAQISAKQPGLYADGRTWDYQSILAEHNTSRSRYPQVKLLNSSEWPVFSQQNWWITVSAQNFATPQAALSWCRSSGFDRDHCFAKLLSSTSGPEGSTLYQR